MFKQTKNVQFKDKNTFFFSRNEKLTFQDQSREEEEKKKPNFIEYCHQVIIFMKNIKNPATKNQLKC